ncbi:MAG: hypothetical protein JW854_04780 [Actinobacteria bacterium]|nr:hypothetical protein [Actinomycetota bacterium]
MVAYYAIKGTASIILFVVVSQAVVSAFGCSFIALRSKKNTKKYFLLGLFLGIVGFTIAYAINVEKKVK